MSFSRNPALHSDGSWRIAVVEPERGVGERVETLRLEY